MAVIGFPDGRGCSPASFASEPVAEAPVNLNGLSDFNPAIAANGSAPSSMRAVPEKKVGS